jgi:tetratricopeptide (TPR) repeat protein
MRRRAVLVLGFGVLALLTGCGRNADAPPKEAPGVVFRSADGRALTLDELRATSGKMSYETVRHYNVPPEADALHKKARESGAAGDYQTALALLARAAQLAPEWPYPAYDTAFTYLLMKDTANARKYYQKTIELAPRGFFTAITALDALDREERRDLPEGTYLAYLSTEWIEDRAKKVDMVRQIVERSPAFAPAWSAYADLLNNDGEKLAAIDKGLAARPDDETKALLEINKALILDRKGDRDGAVKLLGALALDPKSTYAAEQMAKATLAYVAGK